MKRTININLGNVPFIIDEDAYESLNQYLSTIENHFSSSEGCEEIIEDIEVRIAELFENEIKQKKIVSKSDVQKVIEIMGRPSDFGADEYSEDYSKNQSTTNNNEYRTGKKLYRDVDRKMIGGVCAGLAAYFGITNLSLFRVIVLIFATSGIVFFAYIMLWLIVPPATTVSERLEMQGEPVNVSNIARKVEQEITEIGRMISDISKDYKERKKSRKS